MKNSNRLSQSTYKSLRPEKGKDVGVSLLLVARVSESGPDTNFAGKCRAALITLLQVFFIVKSFFKSTSYKSSLAVLDPFAKAKEGGVLPCL